MLQPLKCVKIIRVLNINNRWIRHTKLNYSKKGGSSSPPTTAKNDMTVNIRHNFHKDCEEGLNKQINLELFASYTYFCMATCMRRADVALLGYAQFFAAASAEERHHVQLLADFVNTRGGTVDLRDVPRPDQGPFHDPIHALQQSIELEKKVLVALEELHKLSCTHGDIHLSDFLETNFIPEGYEGIKQLADMLTNVQRAGPGVGVVLLDLDLLRHRPSMHGGDAKK